MKRYGWVPLLIVTALVWVAIINKESGEAGADKVTPPRDESAPHAVAASSSSTAEQKWTLAAGNIWPGVSLYYGPKRMLVGEIVDWSDDAPTPSGKGVLVRMKNGSVEWKDREAIVLGPWYVRLDDPAVR